MKRILVTGALGQIGSELSGKLIEAYGYDNVILSSSRTVNNVGITDMYESVDVTDIARVYDVARRYGVDTIIHLAAILSAKGEENPGLLWRVNMNGLYNVLEVARERGMSVFVPSSIASFGPSTPHVLTPQDTIERPTTIYGVSKVAGELLCDYYFMKYGLDTRGVRFPGIISARSLPGGGTTDYAVYIFHEAVRTGKYTCYLKSDTVMDMVYMPDAIDAVIALMEADPARLKHRNAFNIKSMSVSPSILAGSIGKRIPGFEISYDIDQLRQDIADSWPRSLDDTAAREEWGWDPRFDLEAMTDDIIAILRERYAGDSK